MKESLQAVHVDALTTTKTEEQAKMEQLQRELDQRIATHITQFEQESLELRSQISSLETELSAIRMDHIRAKEQEVFLLETVDTLNRQLIEQLTEQSAVASNNKNVQETQEEHAKREEEMKASVTQATAQVDMLTRQLADSKEQGERMMKDLEQKDEETKQLQTQIDTMQSTHQGTSLS